MTQKRAFMPLYIVLGQHRACMPVYIGKSGDLVGWHRCLTDTQTTEYRATQLLSSIQFKLSHAMLSNQAKDLSEYILLSSFHVTKWLFFLCKVHNGRHLDWHCNTWQRLQERTYEFTLWAHKQSASSAGWDGCWKRRLCLAGESVNMQLFLKDSLEL